MSNNKAFFIGITGSIGSGKSTVTRYLREKGYPVIDADVIAREVVEPGEKAYVQIVEHFGKTFLLENGAIDRKKLGTHVFNHKKDLLVLNEIVHPEIRKLMLDRYLLLSQTHRVVFADVPLLIESGMLEPYHQIWLVYADRDTCLQRILLRDQIPNQLAQAKLDAQMPIDEKTSYSDYVFYNIQSVETLYEQVDSAIKSLKIIR